MRFIFSLIFMTPFWVQFVIAGLIGYVGYDERQDSQVDREATLAQLAAPAPANVPIAEFARNQAADGVEEFSVTAQLAPEHNVRLIKTKNGVTTREDLMMVLVDPEASAGEKVVRAAIVFDPEQQDKMTDWLLSQVTDMGEAGPVVTIAGLVTSPVEASHARDAIADEGLTRGPDFFFMAPFIDGREAGYQAKLASFDRRDGSVFFWIAGAVALVGLAKLVLGRRGTSSPGAAAQAGREPDPDMAPLVAAQSDGFAKWASSPSQAAPARTTPAEYLTLPKEMIGRTGSPLVTTPAPRRIGFTGMVALAVAAGMVLTWLSGGSDRLPGSLPSPEELIASLGGKTMGDDAKALLGPAEPTFSTAAPADPKPALGAPVVKGTDPVAPVAAAAEAEAAPAAASGFKEPPLSTLALIFGLATLVFILWQRHKANSFQRRS